MSDDALAREVLRRARDWHAAIQHRNRRAAVDQVNPDPWYRVFDTEDALEKAVAAWLETARPAGTGEEAP